MFADSSYVASKEESNNSIEVNEPSDSTSKKHCLNGNESVQISGTVAISHDLKNDKSKKRVKRLLPCSMCSKAFKAPSHLLRHEQFHRGVRPYECPVCNKKYKTLSYLKAHKMIHTGERPFMCSVCKKSFIQLNHLKNHEKKQHAINESPTTVAHFQKGSYECTVCKKKFTQLFFLKMHERSHNPMFNASNNFNQGCVTAVVTLSSIPFSDLRFSSSTQ